jgi:hypothetical protein
MGLWEVWRDFLERLEKKENKPMFDTPLFLSRHGGGPAGNHG